MSLLSLCRDRVSVFEMLYEVLYWHICAVFLILFSTLNERMASDYIGHIDRKRRIAREMQCGIPVRWKFIR